MCLITNCTGASYLFFWYTAIMQTVPKQFQFLFPSSSVERLSVERDSFYIIETLLRNATLEAWQWMLRMYLAQDIMHVIRTSSNLRPKDVMLWSSYFDIPLSEISCIQTTSHHGLKNSWAY